MQSAASLLLLLFSAKPASATPPAGYNLVWSDEFNQGLGLSPSSANWNFDTGGGGWGNSELETYVSDTAHCSIVADPNATDGSALQITATNDANGYQSARINTKNKISAQYGFIEARIQLPYGQGIWPAFWMLGSNSSTVTWPACGEMDIMENGGNSSWYGKNQGSLHGTNYSGGNCLHEFYNLPSGQYFQSGYHLFQAQWSPYEVQYFVDGNLYLTRTASDIATNTWDFNHPFNFIANVAIGGTFPGSPDSTTVWPQHMLIDYIRVYQAPSTSLSAPPASVSATAQSNQVALSWAASSGAISYNIYRGTTAGGEAAAPVKTNVTGTSYNDTGLANGTKYYYKVTTNSAPGESGGSTEISATPVSGIATTTIDTLNNWSVVNSKSSSWAIDFSNPDYFNADSARATRTADTTQYLIYAYSNISNFSATVYTYNGPVSVATFWYSTNGRNYTEIPVTVSARTGSTPGWGYYTITPSSALPTGVTDLKVQFTSGTGNAWDPQLAQISITHN